MTGPLRSLARTGALRVNTPVAKARFARVVAAAARPLKLEIGGLRPREGWIVTDVGPRAALFLDATARWPLEDDSVSHVYADNVIEHISLDGARTMFREAARCLRPGGVIRLVTPDIRSHVELYLSGRAAVDSEVGGFYRGIGLVVEHPIDLLRIPIGAFGHHLGYVWDYETLAAELDRAGLRDIERLAIGESRDAAFAGLDSRAGSEGGAQLVVEARAA